MAYLALDIGAGSGRAIVGTIDNGSIRLDEIHRFGNPSVKMGDTLYWDFLYLFQNIKQSIYLAVKKGYDLQGIAIDTWGVDFGLIDKYGRLVYNPVCYRDTRTQGITEKAMAKISKEKLYAVTGIQQMEINSVFQLLSMIQEADPAFFIADKLLFMPDLINYFLTGNVYNEYTIASTSQLLNAETKMWEKYLFDELNLPLRLMATIIQPCSIVGKLKNDIADETKAHKTTVFSVGSHDTASAIAAIPFDGENWAFLSSGTWSLLGIQTDNPILSQEAMASNFTNEGGVNNKILFMRNIPGLWLLQRLIVEWEDSDDDYSYKYLLSECEKSKPFGSIVNSDDAAFTHPLSMMKAIQGYCRDTDQSAPLNCGELVRCVLESLAVKYYFVMKELEACFGKKIKYLSIVGGGSQNELLNQFIANSLNIQVITGLTEATAIGNIVQQAVANKQIVNLDEGHSIIKNSFNFKTYYPEDTEKWTAFATKMEHLFK